MNAQLEETTDATVRVELLRDELVAEDALRRGEDYLRLTIDTIPVLAWCSRPDGSNEFLNRRWLDYTGLTIEEARGWGWKVAIHPDDLPQLLVVWQGLLVSGKSGELEARLRRADGVYRWFLFRVEPLRDPQGTIVKWYGTNIDIDDLPVSLGGDDYAFVPLDAPSSSTDRLSISFSLNPLDHPTYA